MYSRDEIKALTDKVLSMDAVSQATADFGPGERAAWVKQSIDICARKGVLGAGYIPKAYQTSCLANVVASSDLVGELLAQSPKGNPLTSTFKGLADIALGEAPAARTPTSGSRAA